MLLSRLRHRARQRRLAPGSYLTDGENLFRVISLFDNDSSMLATIEDCLTLETRCFAGKELEQLPLHNIRGGYA